MLFSAYIFFFCIDKQPVNIQPILGVLLRCIVCSNIRNIDLVNSVNSAFSGDDP
jgi:hypothetical protein